MITKTPKKEIGLDFKSVRKHFSIQFKEYLIAEYKKSTNNISIAREFKNLKTIVSEKNVKIKTSYRTFKYTNSNSFIELLKGYRKFYDFIEEPIKSIPLMISKEFEEVIFETPAIKYEDSILNRLKSKNSEISEFYLSDNTNKIKIFNLIKKSYFNENNLNCLVIDNEFNSYGLTYQDIENTVFKCYIQALKNYDLKEPKNLKIECIEIKQTENLQIRLKLNENTINKVTRAAFSDIDILVSKIQHGKILTKTFDKVKPSQAEEFKNIIERHKLKIKEQFDNISILRGNFVSFYYNAKQYTNINKDTLHRSCMRNSNSPNLYNCFPEVLGMLSVFDEYNKLKCRSLYWTGYKIKENHITITTGKEIDSIVDLNKPENYIDRIYFDNPKSFNLFNAYAKNNSLKTVYEGDNTIPHEQIIVILPTLTEKELGNFIKKSFKEENINSCTDLKKLFENTWSSPYLDSLRNLKVVKVKGEDCLVLTNSRNTREGYFTSVFADFYNSKYPDLLKQLKTKNSIKENLENIFIKYNKIPIIKKDNKVSFINIIIKDTITSIKDTIQFFKTVFKLDKNTFLTFNKYTETVYTNHIRNEPEILSYSFRQYGDIDKSIFDAFLAIVGRNISNLEWDVIKHIVNINNKSDIRRKNFFNSFVWKGGIQNISSNFFNIISLSELYKDKIKIEKLNIKEFEEKCELLPCYLKSTDSVFGSIRLKERILDTVNEILYKCKNSWKINEIKEKEDIILDLHTTKKHGNIPLSIHYYFINSENNEILLYKDSIIIYTKKVSNYLQLDNKEITDLDSFLLSLTDEQQYELNKKCIAVNNAILSKKKDPGNGDTVHFINELDFDIGAGIINQITEKINETAHSRTKQVFNKIIAKISTKKKDTIEELKTKYPEIFILSGYPEIFNVALDSFNVKTITIENVINDLKQTFNKKDTNGEILSDTKEQ